MVSGRLSNSVLYSQNISYSVGYLTIYLVTGWISSWISGILKIWVSNHILFKYPALPDIRCSAWLYGPDITLDIRLNIRNVIWISNPFIILWILSFAVVKKIQYVINNKFYSYNFYLYYVPSSYLYEFILCRTLRGHW